MGRIYQKIQAVIAIAFLGLFVISLTAVLSVWNPFAPEVKEPSLLSLSLEGLIVESEDFLDQLRTYREDPNIKGLIVQIDSPGGLVGSSQEIYTELRRMRDEWKKPVVVSGGSLIASGAYFAALGADRIVVNPGTLMGSIGVILESSNLSVQKKNDNAHRVNKGFPTGEEFVALESPHFPSILGEMHAQFKLAIQKGRGLSPDVIEKYADGRIFTGETAVRIGFADRVGTFEDALRVSGSLTGLGSQPKLFKPGQEGHFWVSKVLNQLCHRENWIWKETVSPHQMYARLQGKPLYLMPGVL